ncbi:MAG TPA: hypothetical protein VFB34_06870 [Chloroflexota bacterium]|nr:hypothetical protein [Chloroflexota bacterium]
MTERTFDDIIRVELNHIGPSELGRDQATLRQEYISFRREDLLSDPAAPARRALTKAIASVRSYAPNFEPEYDGRFFSSSESSSSSVK